MEKVGCGSSCLVAYIEEGKWGGEVPPQQQSSRQIRGKNSSIKAKYMLFRIRHPAFV